MGPRWRRDGSELFYLKGTTIMAVAVETGGPTFAAGPPRPLFDLPIRVLVNWLP